METPVETLIGVIADFLEGCQPNLETYYNVEDPTVFDGGNFDDSVSHGYEAGGNDAQKDFISLLRKRGLSISDFGLTYDREQDIIVRDK